MNPVFVVLVIVIAIAIWFLLSFAFKPLGSLLLKIGKNAFDQMDDKNENEEKKDE
nr:hypothetical protein [Clostridium sp. Marseille-P7770]